VEKKHQKSAIIEIENLSKTFTVSGKKIEALKEVNLKVYATDFLLIFGPSGCGKSTLLNIMSGLDWPTTGRVLVRDVNIFELGEDKRGIFRSQKLGMIQQMSNWIKSLTVVENIALPLIIAGMSESDALKSAQKIMTELKIDTLARQKPTQLSGGEQQKAALARALVNNPWIVLADEPTGNLDSTSADEMMGIFQYLNTELKRTIILVTHNQAYWTIGKRRLEMKDGRIVKESNGNSKAKDNN